MNTDRLVALLSANLEPVRRTRYGKTLAVAMLTGAGAAFILMIATVGPRAELGSRAHLAWTAVKLLFAASVVGAAAPSLLKSMRPGWEPETHPATIFLPFAAAIAAAIAMLAFVTPANWIAMLGGATSASPARGLICIAIFAVAPFAAIVWALRRGAPTRLRFSGAVAGVVAGGLGAAAYAFNCTSDTLPFIAVCYGAAIAMCALAGAELGPRLLRW